MSGSRSPEIILNLWYVHDEAGIIYSLRARAYVGFGSDKEKLALLQSYALVDYLIATPFPVPERFHTTVIEIEGSRKMPVALKSAIEATVGPHSMFEDVFVKMEEQLPAQTKLSIGQKPLVCITPVLGQDDGTLKVAFSGRRAFDAQTG
ncbi:MAG: hypothetical protein WCA49_00570 [Candidatus Sulfotelmatobacter sp.]